MRILIVYSVLSTLALLALSQQVKAERRESARIWKLYEVSLMSDAQAVAASIARRKAER
jgi:hypothetical protein